MSKRMGTAKQLVELNGKCLLQWVVDAAVRSNLQVIYLVLGCYADRILNTLPQLETTDKITILHNPGYETGMNSSLKCGLLAAQHNYENVMFILGDQPIISPQLINMLLEEHMCSEQKICLPVFKNKNGNPVQFNRIFYKQLLNVEGDQGGRTILRDNPEQIHRVKIDDPNAFFDIDTMEDLRSLCLNLQLKPSGLY